ncbi:MAG: S8 family serine peptidase [Candidatus Sericytochromatia bacterium]|nr:S8 family serine peptidase [Candidatus Sericytochromatia bacterium]
MTQHRHLLATVLSGLALLAACTPGPATADRPHDLVIKRGAASWEQLAALPGVLTLEHGDSGPTDTWGRIVTTQPQRVRPLVADLETNDQAALPLVRNGDGTATGFRTQRVPNDELFRLAGPIPRQQSQWGLTAIQAAAAWDISLGENIVVAVIDTGIDLSHRDLSGNIAATGVNLLNPGGSLDDDFGHGTHVSGIIAGVSNNNVGIAGMAWGAKILPIRVADGSGGTVFNIGRGIQQAVQLGARVINISLGNKRPSRFLKEQVDLALASGIVIVAAAGNAALEGNALQYPAAYPGVISVGAVGLDQTALASGQMAYIRPDFSAFNSAVTLCAPGIDILSTVPVRFGEYAYSSGTSMAAPFVTGTVALMLSRNPAMSPQQVLDKLQATATDLGARGLDPFYGAGLLNAAAAVQ